MNLEICFIFAIIVSVCSPAYSRKILDSDLRTNDDAAEETHSSQEPVKTNACKKVIAKVVNVPEVEKTAQVKVNLFNPISEVQRAVETEGCKRGYYKGRKGNCVASVPIVDHLFLGDECPTGFDRSDSGNCVPIEDYNE